MKLAFFSDVHANIAALKEVVVNIEGKNVEQIICAGDLVGYAPFPNEVIDLMKSKHIPCVMGNYDDGVGNQRLVCGCDYKDEYAQRLGEQSIVWSKENTSEENKGYLRNLPYEIRLEIGNKKLLVVHGSSKRLNEYLHKDISDDYLEALLNEEEVDVLICGHTHVPYHKELKSGHIINVGSVGKPKHGNPSAVYALVEVNEKINVEFIEVTYDVELTALAIENSALPNEFANILRSGKV